MDAFEESAFHKKPRLYYFSRSADKPPGSGRNEFVQNPQSYTELAQIPNWRQMLSNFWVASFYGNNYSWNTVEHFFQSHKIALADPQKASLFTLDSGSSLGQSGGAAAQKQRKMVRLTPAQLDQWNQIKDTVLLEAFRWKFKQNPELAKILLLTQNAQLWHGAPRVPAARQYQLEQVRSELLNSGITYLFFEEALPLMESIQNYRIYKRLPDETSILEFEDRAGNLYQVKVYYAPDTNQIYPPFP
jgi:predicted NAD-dependent protein-ADP-ribosyltransferase YbiA (DUF1768 family)